MYRQLNIPYFTPTIGLFIKPQDYIRYIEEFHSIHKEELVFIDTDKGYPVATLSGIEINFMHYSNNEEAKFKYWKRYNRIRNCKMLVKIDFGKPGYTSTDIQRWNDLRIKNSLAFYPSTIEPPKNGIYNGIAIPDWKIDGAAMFDISRKYFDVFMWVRNGIIDNGWLYKLLNILLFDPTAPKRIARQMFNRTQ